MNKISSITIAKNEEANLARCLKSLKGIVDELVVLVDESSTDGTLEIAREYADVVQSVAWEGYSKTKSKAVELCSNDWIFWIDADEEATEELKNELNEWKNSTPSFPAYRVARRAFFLNKWIKHSGWYPGYATRLFNKHKAHFSDSDVHEFLHVDGKIGTLKNDLNHYTDPTIHHYFVKFNNYTSLAAEEIVRKGKKVGITDLLLRPFFIFIKMFIFRLGILDGLHGFILAGFSSMYVFVKYAKAIEKKLK